MKTTSMAYGNLVKVRRKIETARLRKAMPWATDREISATVEHLLFHLDLSGHFAANQFNQPAPAVDTSRGPSGKIWEAGSGTDFAQSSVMEDPTKGNYLWDDFTSFGGLVASKVGTYASDSGSWKSYEETGGSIVQSNTLGVPTLATPASGVITMTTDGTANDTVALAAGYDTGGSWMLTGNAMPSLYYETRVLMTGVTAMDFFVGLIEKGAAAAAFLFTTGDALNQKSMIGFNSLTAAPTAVKALYGKNGVAPVNVTNGSFTGLWVASTWTKLGFVYHPNFTNGRLLQYFQDGQLLGWVTDCSISAFPTAKALTPAFIIQASAAGLVAGTLSSDWVKAGQIFSGF